MSFAHAVVDCYAPGVMQSVEIPLDDFESCMSGSFGIDIDFRSFFKKVKKNKSVDDKHKTNCDPSALVLVETDQLVSENASLPSSIIPSGLGNSSCRNDNIIDRLVRKYYSQSSFNDDTDDDDVDSNQYNSESYDSDDSPEENSGRKRRRVDPDDCYDEDDPFIDDSERVAEIESDLRMKRVRTHDKGFFVSRGKLQTVHIPEEERVAKSAPKRRVRTENAVQDLRRRHSADKPIWTPNETVTLAIEQFRTFYGETGIKLSKSSHLPSRLDDSLLALNRLVLTQLPDALQPTSGYAETIHEILGSNVPLGRVRSALSRLAAKDRADVAGAYLDGLVEQLCTDLKPLVVPCPAAMQPAFKAKAAAAAAVAATNSSLSIGGARVSSTVGLTSCVKPTRPSDPQNIIYGQQKETMTPPEDPPADTQSESVSAPCTQQSIVENSESSLSTPAAATTSAEAISVPLTVFSWYCKWNVATRGQLLGVVQAVTDWVALENVYREKLTVVNMRDMSEDDCEFMDEKDELTAVLTMVAESMPPSCCNGDVSSVRRALAHERIRIKKIQLKEQQAAEAQSAAVAASIDVEGGTETKAAVDVTSLNSLREVEAAVPASLKVTGSVKTPTQIARVPSAALLSAPVIASAVVAVTKPQTKSSAPSSPVKRPPPATAPSSPIPSVSSSSSLLLAGGVQENAPRKTAGSSPLKAKRVKKVNQKYVEKDEPVNTPTPRKSPASKLATSTNVASLNDCEIDQTVTVPTGTANDGMTSPGEGEMSAIKKKRTPKPKPMWSPCEEVQLALEQFGAFYHQTGIKLAKSSSVPLNLEDSLYLLHRIVCVHHGDTLHGTSGYLEAVHAILGGEVAVGKIKAVFSRCTAQDKAKIAREALDRMCAQLCAALNALAGPCPESMQPAYKAKAAAAKASSIAAVTVTSTSSSASAVEVETPAESTSLVAPLEFSETVPMVVCEESEEAPRESTETSSHQPSASEQPHAANTEATSTVIEQIALPPEDPCVDTSIAAPCTQQSIVENSQSSLSTPAVVATAATTGADVLSAPLTVFSWYCKWNVATRGQLLGVVQAVTDWVALENAYREKLTEVHKKALERGQFQLVDEAVETTVVLTTIAASLPPLCLNGDLSAVRKALANEKSRIKKIQQKEQQNTLSTAIVPTIPFNAGASGLGSCSMALQQIQSAALPSISPSVVGL